MGNSTTGIQPLGVYNNNPRNDLTILLGLIPDPDGTGRSGGGFLDEMSPMAAVQLRVEIAAILAVIP